MGQVLLGELEYILEQETMQRFIQAPGNNPNKLMSINIDDSSWMRDQINQHVKKLLIQKDDLIKEKIIEKGFGHLFNGIEKRRFKRIAIEQTPTEEKYYVDDGSDQGVLIITFKKMDISSMTLSSDPITLTLEWY